MTSLNSLKDGILLKIFRDYHSLPKQSYQEERGSQFGFVLPPELSICPAEVLMKLPFDKNITHAGVIIRVVLKLNRLQHIIGSHVNLSQWGNNYNS